MATRQEQWDRVQLLLAASVGNVRGAIHSWPDAGLVEIKSQLEATAAFLEHAWVEAQWLVEHLEVVEDDSDQPDSGEQLGGEG